MGVRTTDHAAETQELLRWALHAFGRDFALFTSFQREGMVLLDMAARLESQVRVLTINTGRLPAATHAMIERVEAHYGIHVEQITPDADEVDAMVRLYGAELFRDSVAARKVCCEVRKVRPFERVLPSLRAYAVGLRREQAETRANVLAIEQVKGVYKLSPLAAWSAHEVQTYLRRHEVPEHPLYAAGYATIGCDPCTRAVGAGEDERAGRWWWEWEADKECGLHFTPAGRTRSAVDVLLEEVLAARNA